jgi:hypothetical protein
VPISAITGGRLQQVIRDIKRTSGTDLADLTVMSELTDPYRLDTKARHRDAQWFLDQIDLLVPYGTIHLRGLHYLIVVRGDIRKPDGEVYTNTDEDSVWLGDKAAKAARWLLYVPFGRIVDERNAAPEIYIPEIDVPERCLSSGDDAYLPDLDEMLPRFECSGIARQPYRLIFIGEKTSLGSVLRPIAKDVGAELLLPTGEMSDTLIHDMASRAVQDGRPAVVFYFSDFDPSGYWQMPVSVSRKLQALRDLKFPGLDIQLHHVGLTLDQVKQFNLPSTPLKESELRGDKWRGIWGHEQTEIDAMIALYPGELARIVREAIAPFHDPTLNERLEEEKDQWVEQANEWLSEHPRYLEAQAELADAHERARHALGFLDDAQRRARAALEEIEPPAGIYVPEAELPGNPPVPLFTTDDDFVTATSRLREHQSRDGGVP